ncbi:MAG: hypothetical protein ACHQFZ_06235 [Acidimicrobiales bacterium]
MADNPEGATTGRPRRARRQSAVPRSVVMGLDKIERNVSFIAGAIALVLAGLFTPHLFKDTFITVTAKPVRGHTCATPYHWNSTLKTCSHLKLTHPSDWLPQFILIVVMAGAIVLFAYLRKRVGVAFGGFFLGLALGSVGLPFLLLGGWLLLRALRLQRYGNASFFGSSRIAREQAQAKREGRPVAPRRTRAKVDDAAATLIRPVAPAPSKRYTPKKPVRKR